MKTLFLSLGILFALLLPMRAQNAKALWINRGHTTNIGVYAFSPNGDRLYVQVGIEMQIWNVESGQLEKTYSLDRSLIRMKVSTDEKYIIGAEFSWGGAAEIFRYDAKTGEKLPSVKPATSLQYPQVSALTFLPDDKKFAAYIWRDTEIKIYNTATGELEYSFPVARAGKEIRDLNFAPNGSKAIVAYSDSTVYLYSLTGGAVTDSLGAGYMVASVEVSANGKILMTSGSKYSTEKPIRIFNLETREKIAEWEGRYDSNYPAISFDGSYATYSGDAPGYFFIYERLHPNINRIVRKPIEILGLQFAPNKNYIAGKATDGKLWLWNAETGDVITSFSKITDDKHNGSIAGVSISPDYNTLATIGKDGYLKTWDLKTGEYKNSLTFDSPGVGHCITYTDDNKYIAAGIGSNVVKLSNSDYSIIGVISDIGPNSVSFYKDTSIYKDGPNDFLIGGSGGAVICGEAGSDFWELDTTVKYVNTVAYCDGGEKVLFGAKDKRVRIYRKGGMMDKLWELEKELVADADDNYDMPGVVAVGALDKSNRFFSVCHSQKATGIWIWNLDTFQLSSIIPFEPEPSSHPLGGMIAAIATHAEDKIITGDNGGTIRIYDIEKGKLIYRIDTLSITKLGQYHPDITSLSISKDDKILAAGFSDGSAMVYDISEFVKSIKDNDKAERLEVYPNPAENFIYIKGEGVIGKTVQIYTLQGIKAAEINLSDKIDVSNLSPGIYYITIGERVAKFVKL